VTLAAPPRDHTVTFYDRDVDAVAEITDFLSEGLARLERVVSIATPQHRHAVETELREAGLDIEALADRSWYVPIDARELLNAVMSQGVPSRKRFRDVVVPLMERVGSDGRPLRVFGEGVALLWEEGNVAGAVGLEFLWNEYAHEREMKVMCSYPLHSMLDRELSDVTAMCAAHSDVRAPSSYAADARTRTDAPDEATRIFVPATPAVTAARAFLQEVFTAWGETEFLQDALVVISELATNAVFKGRSAFRATITRGADAIRITVEDTNVATPTTPEQSMNPVGGIAPGSIGELSSRFGTDLLPRGKAVWCEFDR